MHRNLCVCVCVCVCSVNFLARQQRDRREAERGAPFQAREERERPPDLAHLESRLYLRSSTQHSPG